MIDRKKKQGNLIHEWRLHPAAEAHLLMGHRDKSVLGQLPHYGQVGPHIQLTAHQDHFGVGAELLRLTLPL